MRRAFMYIYALKPITIEFLFIKQANIICYWYDGLVYHDQSYGGDAGLFLYST